MEKIDITKLKSKTISSMVLIKIEKIPDKTSGGIFVVDNRSLGKSKVEPDMDGVGEVVLCGKKYKPFKDKDAIVECPVNKGDRVVFRRFIKDASSFLGTDDEEYSFIHIDDIHAIVDKEDKVGYIQ